MCGTAAERHAAMTRVRIAASIGAAVEVVFVNGAPGPVALLVGAGKRKVDEPAPAQDLYVGGLFRLRRAFAEAAGVPWFILSPRYGLVAPDELLGPYDLPMIRQPIAYRREWSVTVAARVVDLLGRAEGRCLAVHAGDAYVGPLRPVLEAAGWVVLTPLRGLN
jgi:hypothetical protein